MPNMDVSNKVSNKTVKGSVKKNSARWLPLIGADCFILDMIVSSYKMSFFTKADSIEVGSNKTSLNNQDFVYHEILSLIETGCAASC